jgi:hypothetical protein
MRRLMAFRWPGNVQPSKAIERAVAFAGGQAQLDDSVCRGSSGSGRAGAVGDAGLADEGLDLDEFIAHRARVIQRSLERTGATGAGGQAAQRETHDARRKISASAD